MKLILLYGIHVWACAVVGWLSVWACAVVGWLSVWACACMHVRLFLGKLAQCVGMLCSTAIFSHYTTRVHCRTLTISTHEAKYNHLYLVTTSSASTVPRTAVVDLGRAPPPARWTIR